MLKNTDSVIGKNYYKNGFKNQKNEKPCKNTLKILQAVGKLQENITLQNNIP